MKMNKKGSEQSTSNGLQEVIRESKIADERSLKENFWPVEFLPSKYKFYGESVKILARPLNVKEVKQLSSLTEANVDFILNDILRKTTIGVPVEELLIRDKLFLIFWLRENTYRDSGFSLEFDCPLCGAKNKEEFDLAKLDVREVKEEVDENAEIVLKKSQDKIKIRFLRVSDEEKLSQFKTKTRNSLKKYDEELLNIAIQIKEINGEPSNSLMNTYEYVESMSPIDFAYLLSYIAHIDFGVNPVLNTRCSSCGGDAPTGVSFQPEFFIPTYKFE